MHWEIGWLWVMKANILKVTCLENYSWGNWIGCLVNLFTEIRVCH